MMMREFIYVCTAIVLTSLFVSNVSSLNPAISISRRTALTTGSISIATVATINTPPTAWPDSEITYSYEQRDRQGNKNAIIREDYWYMTGKTPPRKLQVSLSIDDPQWNAFGSCETSTSSADGSNSCTYVSLKQRIPAYTKYGFAISDGAKEYEKLGMLLKRLAVSDPAPGDGWKAALSFLTNEEKTIPPAIIDAELKMILFATAVLTSANFPTPGRELLIARFYANEASFAAREMAAAIKVRDAQRALQAWDFGKDSWNSYFQVVNKAITSKVGEKFANIV